MGRFFLALVVVLGGCSLMVGGGDQSTPDGSPTSSPDGSMADGSPVDSSNSDADIDAPPPACSVYTDEGCVEGRTCKDPVNPGCLEILDTGQDGQDCGFVSDCDTGLGCYMATCRHYCGPDGECPNGGWCVVTYCVP